MNIFQIEKERESLYNKLNQKISSRKKFISILYFLNLLNQESRIVFEAYALEFLPEFYKIGKNFAINCLDIKLSKELLNGIYKLKTNNIVDQEELHQIINWFEEQINVLTNILEGKSFDLPPRKNAFFPLIEFDYSDSLKFGIMDSASVMIRPSGWNTIFHIMPSETKIEERIKNQVEKSWKLALEYSKKINRSIKEHHEVFISFDEREGFYVGVSLGISLTIVFIEEILRFYNSPVIVDIKDRIAFTGGMEEDGTVPEIGEEIIDIKCESVFFSSIRNFVVPGKDKIFAERKIEELKKDYPDRDIEITGVEDLRDLLNRRNIVDIKKQNSFRRSYNFIKKNYHSTVLFVILVALVGYYFYVNTDLNPSYFENHGYTVYVMNEQGKVLWSKEMVYNADHIFYQNYPLISQKIIDIDDDGRNEVLFANERINTTNEFGRISCYDYQGELLWKYKFNKTISTENEEFTPEHVLFFQKNKIDSSKTIFLFSKHKLYYPSAIFKLNLKTKKIEGDIFWHAGAIAAITVDKDSLDQKYITSLGVNSSFDRTVLFSLYEKNLKGEGPCNKFYDFEGLEVTEFRNYLFLPKSDFTFYKNIRYDTPIIGQLDRRGRYYDFAILQDYPPYYSHGEIIYSVRSDFQKINVNVDDRFHMLRDSLVHAGAMDPPLTNTIEYRELLKEQIRYWDGKELVAKEEYFKN